MSIKNKRFFKEGDHVVVSGTTITTDGPTSRNMSIAQVIGVGSEELFLKCSKTNRVYKRPLENCYKIPLNSSLKSCTNIRKPALGDFVLSYSGSRFTQGKKIIGILIEVIDNPPSDVDARILYGEETYIVPLHSVIVIESLGSES